MRRGTLLVLVLLVLGLGYLWLEKQREIARGGPLLEQYPLCPGLFPERVRAVRIDHLERGFQLKLERDAAGQWFLTDPLAYPAEGALARSLLDTLAAARGEPVLGLEPAELALDPPKIVLECLQAGDAGETTTRIELGRVDLAPELMFARVPGHPNGARPEGSEIFRTTRSLANTLERNPDDYRSRKATGLLPQDVTSLRRRGEVHMVEAGGRVVLDLDALLGPDGWKRVDSAVVSLDPDAMGLLVRGACEVTIERFIDDSPTDLAPYGLDAPAFRVELESLGGRPVTLEFGHSPREDALLDVGERTWYCQRQGFAHVWEVRRRDVELLTRPADLFYDQNVVRVLRTDVQRLELEGGGARRVLELEKGRWTVRERGLELETPRFPGDEGAIEAALAQLESAELGEYLPGVAFEPGSPELAFGLWLKNGAQLGGRLGREARDPKSGAVGRQYLRLGDELVGLIGPEVALLCARPLDEFRARKLHQIPESLVRWIELEHSGRTYAYVNTGDNRWTPRGQSIGAPPGFVQSLDALLNLGVQRWLEPGALPALEQELIVRIQPTDGEDRELVLGRSAEGRTLCRGPDGTGAEIDGALFERLRALF